MADDLEFGIEFQADDAEVKKLATSVGDLSDTLRTLSRSLGSAATGAERIERGIVGLGKSASQAKRELQALSNVSIRNQIEPVKNPNSGEWYRPSTKVADHNSSMEAARQARAEAEVNAQLKEQIAARRALVELQRQNRLASQQGPKLETGTGAGSAQQVAGRMTGNMIAAEAKEQAAAISAIKNANLEAAKASMEHANRLTNLRYSLYDVRNTMLATSMALGAMNIATIKMAMDYETAMAQISRTTGARGAELEALEDDFRELAQTIPTAFKDLAEIGTLGGQLNIPQAQLADFTRTVAQFTATTNVSVKDSATAFGRLDALLDDVNGNYDALGSSILQVGVNSVATETEIIATTNQITAAGQQAGFSAKEIIGLAASYASLGVAPEAARGTTIRFFSTINTAVAESNENLEALARLAGTSAADFADAWDNRPGEAMNQLLAGMNAASDSGANLENVIRSMGITAVRDINALLKLAQNSDIVAQSFTEAAAGFDNGTALGSAFAVQAETMASKLQMLVNSFQALFAELGSSGLGPLGAMVDGLKDLVVAATELADNPFVQWFTLVIGAGTALAAIFTLLGSGVVRLGTTAIAASQAFTTLRFEMLQSTGGALGLKAAVDATTGSMMGSAAAARAMRVGLLSLGAIGVVSVALGAVMTLVDGISESMKSAGDKAREAWGDFTTLGQALKADTDVYRKTGEHLGYVQGQLTTTTEHTAEWAGELQRATGVQLDLGDSAIVTTSAVQAQTYAIGQNTAQWLANKLATDENVASLFRLNSQIAAAGGPTLDTDGFIAANVRGDVEAAREIVSAWNEEYKAWMNAQDAGTPWLGADITRKEVEALSATINTLVDGALSEAAMQGEVTSAVFDALGISQENAGDAAYYAGDALQEEATALEVTAARAKELADLLATGMQTENLVMDMANDFYALAEGIYENGNAFDYLSRQGSGNMENLQKAVVSSILAGEAMGLSTTQSIAVVFSQLQAMGVETANLLASVANSFPGVSVGGVMAAMKSATPAMNTMGSALAGVGKQAQSAARKIGGGGGGGGGGKKGLGGAAKETAKEIRTLTDYSSDLANVWSRAFNIRFGAQKELDSITSGWNNVRQASIDAAEAIRQANATIQGLSAERGTYEYFLGVADMYDDSIRAAEIRAKLAEIDADLADEQSNLTKEQQKNNKTLEGNSDAAIENRKTITGMVSSYQALIGEYAASGMSQDELQRKSAELKNRFMQEASQLGFNQVELGKYAAAFDDVTLAIQRVPRNITVAANPNPALQALAELETKARKSGEQAGRNFSGGFGSTSGGGISAGGMGGNDHQWLNLGSSLGSLIARGMNDQVRHSFGKGVRFDIKNVGGLLTIGAPGFAEGGYTGGGGVNDVKGVVHGREFVVDAPNTKRLGLPFLNALNNGKTPVAANNSPSAVIAELSPTDRALLRAVSDRPIVLDSRTIGGAVNALAVATTKTGSN